MGDSGKRDANRSTTHTMQLYLTATLALCFSLDDFELAPCMPRHCRKVLEAGADSIAVISAVTKAEDVDEAIKQWSALFESRGR